ATAAPACTPRRTTSRSRGARPTTTAAGASTSGAPACATAAATGRRGAGLERSVDERPPAGSGAGHRRAPADERAASGARRVPGLSLTDRGRIDLSGTNGATLIVVADGAVELSGAQGSLVKADATDAGGAGGTIDLTSRGESVTIGMPLSLAGGDGGLGGTL